jgi:hypothetical protein
MEAFNPFNALKKFNQQWEKQANDYIHTVTNNKGFIKFSKAGTDAQVRFMETYGKNQELIANQLNIPTKTDMTKVAKLSIQTEEKLDLVEEQIWKLQESVDSTNNELGNIVEVSSDIVKLSKQIKSDMAKTQKELTVAKELRSELEQVKSEISEIRSLKEELALLRELIVESLNKQGQLENQQIPIQASTHSK